MRNDALHIAIKELHRNQDHSSRDDFYRCLSQGVLLVAVGKVPDIEMNGTLLEEDTRISILTTDMPDGGTAILAFTDIESLRAYSPATPHIAMRSVDVLEAVIDNDYDALIVNAAGPWARITREDIPSILQRGPQ
jgi:hypothetical protein